MSTMTKHLKKKTPAEYWRDYWRDLARMAKSIRNNEYRVFAIKRAIEYRKLNKHK